jgi:hypothetical protein
MLRLCDSGITKFDIVRDGLFFAGGICYIFLLGHYFL